MARLLFALLLAVTFVAPDAAAKTPKKPKGAKPAKEAANIVSFTIARPENAGMMNTVPSRLVFEPRDGIVSSHLTHLGLEPKGPAKDRGLVLVGGDTIQLSVRPGTYSVQALTPVESQPPSVYGRKKHVWESRVVKVQLARGEAITLVVEAGVDGVDYNGSWVIAKADPAASQPVEADSQGDGAAAARD